MCFLSRGPIETVSPTPQGKGKVVYSAPSQTTLVDYTGYFLLYSYNSIRMNLEIQQSHIPDTVQNSVSSIA